MYRAHGYIAKLGATVPIVCGQIGSVTLLTDGGGPRNTQVVTSAHLVLTSHVQWHGGQGETGIICKFWTHLVLYATVTLFLSHTNGIPAISIRGWVNFYCKIPPDFQKPVIYT